MRLRAAGVATVAALLTPGAADKRTVDLVAVPVDDVMPATIR